MTTQVITATFPRRIAVLPPQDLGWFGALLRGWVGRSLAKRTVRDWERLYPGLSADARADRRIARAARLSALSGALTAAGALVGEALTIVTDGLAAPIGLSAAAVSVATQIIASAKVQIDLVHDLASIYGVSSDGRNTTELAEVFDLVFDAGKARGAWRGGGVSRPATDRAILTRLGLRIVENATLGLVPLVGIPVSAVRSYRATVRVGEAARRVLRRRAALRPSARRRTATELRGAPASPVLAGA